tara:strand:+ start:6466 stop:8325 length:1860 start_codon:yes stop_codon:yes gene_type:complete
MAENKEINLGSLLTAKKAEIKTAKDRDRKDYILKTVLDFGERFMSSFLIDQPAAMKKEFIQANLEDARFEAALKREELKAKNSYAVERKEDLDYINSFSTPEQGYLNLAEKNFLETKDGKKFTALGAEDAYVSFPTEVTANILKAKQEYLDTEAARLKEIYEGYIKDPNKIIEELTEPDRISKEIRDKLYAKTYADAEAQFGTFNFLKGLFGANTAAHSRFAYLQDEIENRINEFNSDAQAVAKRDTLSKSPKLSEDMLKAPFELGTSYTNRFTKLKTAFGDLDIDADISEDKANLIKRVFNIPAGRILVLPTESNGVTSGTNLTSQVRDEFRDEGKTNNIVQNIILESSTSNFRGKVTEGSELRRRSDSALGINVDLEADRQFVVRQKGVDANGDTVYKKQSISLVEALISDLALGAEFFRYRDMQNGQGLSTVQSNDVGYFYERKYLQFLVESGNLWFDTNGVMHYDRPSLAKDITAAKDLTKGYNEADYIYSILTKQREEESISSNSFLEQSIAAKINSLKNSVAQFPESADKIYELENLNSEKAMNQEFLINLAMPPKELEGKLVKYKKDETGNFTYYIAGDLSAEESQILYNDFIKAFNDNEDLPLLKTIFKIK